MKVSIIDGNRLAAWTGFANRERMKIIPGALYSKRWSCWTYPLAYPSAVALGIAATDLHETVEPDEVAAEWVLGESAAWSSLAAEASRLVVEPDKEVPGWFAHQVQGALWLSMPGAMGGRLDTGETGSGKTATSLRGMWHVWSNGERGIALVSTLVSVKSGWASEVERVKGDLPLPGGAEWKVFVIRGNITQRRKMLAAAAEANKESGGVGVVVVVNHELLSLHSRLAGWGDIALRRCPKHGGIKEGDVVKEASCQAHPKELNAMDFAVVVLDECFVPSALVDTPSGPREIGSLQEGDLVWGFNEETGKVEATAVKAVMRRKSAVVGDFVTPGHPVRVSSGYYPVADLRESDRGFTLGGGDVPTLREDVLSRAIAHTPWAEVLFKGVLRGGSGVHGSGSGTLSAGARADNRAPGRAGEADRTPVRTDEPLQGPRGAGAQARGRVRLSVSGREREGTDGATSSTAVSAWGGLDRGARGAGAWEGSRGEVVRVGSGAPGEDALRGDRWALTPSPEGEGAGRPEGRVLGLGRLDGSEVHESRDPDLAASVPVGDPVDVVNIETGTSNYFVHGLLVHNCHRMMDPTSQVTRAAWYICDRAPRVWGLTGTPGSRRVMENTWALLRLVYGDKWPPRGSWLMYFAQAGYNMDGFWEVGGLRPEREDEFRLGYGSITRRVLKSQVMDLPPLLRGGPLERIIPMSKEQRASYDSMRDHLWAESETGKITAGNVLVKAGRLTLMASVSGKRGKVTIDPDGTVHEEMDLTLPSNKVDAVLEMIRSGDIEEGTVFQFVSSRLMFMLRDKMVEKKLISNAEQFGMIASGVSEAARTYARERFQAGRIPYFGFTTKAGGAGITLTRANTMVAVQRPWSSIEHLQARDRVHRIGSEIHESVSIIDLVSEETIEFKQMERLASNLEALEDVVNDVERMKEMMFG